MMNPPLLVVVCEFASVSVSVTTEMAKGAVQSVMMETNYSVFESFEDNAA